MISYTALPKLVSETRTDSIDFASFLLAGQSGASVAASVAVYTGVDAAPAAVVASAAISGTAVNVKYGAGVVGTIYAIRLDITTAAPAGILPIAYFLAVVPDAV